MWQALLERVGHRNQVFCTHQIYPDVNYAAARSQIMMDVTELFSIEGAREAIGGCSRRHSR